MKEKKHKSNLHAGHRSRMRARYDKDGFEAFSDHECLEFILYNTMKRVNTNEIAHELINKFGSIKGVLDASYEELIKVNGVGDVTARYLTGLNSMISDMIVDQLGSSGKFDIMNAAVTANWVMKIPEVAGKIVVIPCGNDGEMNGILYFEVSGKPNFRHLIDFIIDLGCKKYVIFLTTSDIMNAEEAETVGRFTKLLGVEMIETYRFENQHPIPLVNHVKGE